MKHMFTASAIAILSGCSTTQSSRLEGAQTRIQLMQQIEENCRVIRERDGVEPGECQEARDKYTLAKSDKACVAHPETCKTIDSGTRFSDGGGSSRYRPHVINTYVTQTRKGGWRSTTYINGHFSGSTYVSPPRKR